jgi:hypothetical protein
MSNVDETLEAEKLSSVATPTSASHPKDILIDERAVKKLVRKIDWEILPMMSMFYLLSFLVCCSMAECLSRS